MDHQVIGELRHTLQNWRGFRLKLVVQSLCVGFAAGFIVVMFRLALETAEALRGDLYQYLSAGHAAFTVGWFFLLLAIAQLLGLIVKLEPMSGGSGIPQIKGAILGLVRMNWLRVLTAKFIGAVLAIGAGLSVGNEAPSVQMGAAVGQGCSQILNKTKMEEKYLLTGGASAGLAAVFNAPLAGVIFSLEELQKNFSPAVLMSAIAASLSADWMVRLFYGREPFWNFSGIPALPFRYYALLVILGAVAGVLGVAFNQAVIKALNAYARQQLLPKKIQAAFPLVIGGIAGFVLPEILGGGSSLIDRIADGHFGLAMLLVILGAKFLFTMLSYGAGVPGGIFLPMLVLGALVGGAFSKTILFFGFSHDYHATWMILGMAAYFTAIVKAPVTGSILITEMTGSFRHLPEMIAVCMIAYITADIARSKPIYDTLLERSLQAENPDRQETGRQTITEMIVCMGSQLDGRRIRDVAWPADCLLICIRRGEREITPKEDIKLSAGDYLYIASDERYAHDIRAIAE